MRIKLIFKGNKSLQTQANIRGIFVSFLKRVFQTASEEKYNELFGFKKVKPYTFSPYFGESFKEGKIGSEIFIIFSSGDFEIISTFWNGILRLQEKGEDFISIDSENYWLKDIKLLPIIKIRSSKVLFKTIGVSVLTDPSASPKDFHKWFIVPEENNLERFNDILRLRTAQKYEWIKGKKLDIDLNFELCKGESGLGVREIIIPGLKGNVKGFKGYFYLENGPEILQFLYDYGLGVRTGQGFGLLEVVKEM